jgi:hypothetical protein
MSILSNANYVSKVVKHRCGLPNPIIAVELAAEAALPLLFVPWTFSCTDWVKASVGISWKCGKKLQAVAKHVYGPKFTSGAAAIYELTGLSALENALWVWFVMDLAVDFAVNFTSLMYIENKCELPIEHAFQCGLSSIFTDTGGDVLINGIGSSGCVLIGGNEIQVTFGCYADISYSCKWVPFHNDPANFGSVTTWLEADDGSKVALSSSGKPDKSGAAYTVGLQAHNNASRFGGTSYKLKFVVNGGVMGCTEGSLTVSGHGKPQPLIPAGCFSDISKNPLINALR